MSEIIIFLPHLLVISFSFFRIIWMSATMGGGLVLPKDDYILYVYMGLILGSFISMVMFDNTNIYNSCL